MLIKITKTSVIEFVCEFLETGVHQKCRNDVGIVSGPMVGRSFNVHIIKTRQAVQKEGEELDPL